MPLSSWADALNYLMQSKSTVDNGWWWFNPMVGAPFGLHQLAFPANSNVDQLIVWAVSRIVPDALTAINFSWVLMIVLSGWAATWCARRPGLSYPSSIVVGTSFALSPYALYKNIAHFGMVVYLVPFVCTVALQLRLGKLPEHGYWRGSGAVLLAGSALLGFNYIYYPFFGCFFIVAAVLIGFSYELAARCGPRGRDVLRRRHGMFVPEPGAQPVFVEPARKTNRHRGQGSRAMRSSSA